MHSGVGVRFPVRRGGRRTTYGILHSKCPGLEPAPRAVQKESGQLCRPCNTAAINTSSQCSLYGAMYEVPGITSLRVSGTRPARPDKGKLSRRRTASMILCDTLRAAVGLSLAI